MNSLFLQDIATLDAPMLMKFILAYNKGQCEYRDRKPTAHEGSHIRRWTEDVCVDRALPCSLHEPVIELLTNSLRISLVRIRGIVETPICGVR